MPGRVVLFTENAINILTKENLFFSTIKQKKEHETKEEKTKPKKETKKSGVKKE